MNTTSWPEAARKKVIDAPSAAALVKSGDRVYLQGGCAVPERLVTALIDRYEELKGVEIVHLHTEGPADYTLPHIARHIRHNALFIGTNTRSAVRAGLADYTPVMLSEIPRLFETTMPLDVALIHVTPPDRFGFCSLGISVDCAKPAALSAKTVVALANDCMPRTLGDSFLHVSQIDYFVPVHASLLELPSPPSLTETAQRIGENVASLVEDGSTLQIGIGWIPNAVLTNLKDRRHLGLHTEMFSDGVLDLFEAGVIDNEAKTYHQGKAVAAFVMGSKRLYDFVDDNPMIEMHPVTFTNDPFAISQNAKMVAINSAIEVDLTGQVCADSIGHELYSGTGGQLDFVRGAARSPGGKSVIALPSTTVRGTVSRITPELKPGAGVVVPRGDVQYVVTEYGVAHLHGRTIRERARSLIAIAHPDHRKELTETASQLHLI